VVNKEHSITLTWGAAIGHIGKILRNWIAGHISPFDTDIWWCQTTFSRFFSSYSNSCCFVETPWIYQRNGSSAHIIYFQRGNLSPGEWCWVALTCHQIPQPISRSYFDILMPLNKIFALNIINDSTRIFCFWLFFPTNMILFLRQLLWRLSMIYKNSTMPKLWEGLETTKACWGKKFEGKKWKGGASTCLESWARIHYTLQICRFILPGGWCPGGP
jgi:hypothetical protein